MIMIDMGFYCTKYKYMAILLSKTRYLEKNFICGAPLKSNWFMFFAHINDNHFMMEIFFVESQSLVCI